MVQLNVSQVEQVPHGDGIEPVTQIKGGAHSASLQHPKVQMHSMPPFA